MYGGGQIGILLLLCPPEVLSAQWPVLALSRCFWGARAARYNIMQSLVFQSAQV